MFFGPNSRAAACATARRPILALAKRRIAASAAQARRRTGEEDIALAAGQHQARGLAAGEEVGIASHLPDLAEHPFGGVENRKVDVGADVEDANLERRVLVGIAEKRDDLVLLARIERARVNFAAGLLDLLDERFELGAVAASREHRKALGGKLLCNLAADKITGADHGHGRVSLLHGTSPGSGLDPVVGS